MSQKGGLFLVWVSDEGARLFLGLERPAEQRNRWAFIGEMTSVKELNALGVWMTIRRIEERERGTEAKIIKTWSVSPKLCLIRYERIVHAQHLGKDSDGLIGFKPSSA
jgi:hypothetical protein